MEVRLLEDGDIVKETQKAIEQKKKVLGKKITGILSFDCIHRRVELENKNLVEQYGELFADIPTIGFYSYGEVHIGHMNQTATMLIFEYNSLNHNVRQENRLLSKEKQRLTQANHDLKREVFELKRKLKLATRALKQFNIALEAEINERTKREEEIRYLSYHDELTGLYNRRFYEEAIKNLDTKTNLPISIIIGDVNDLKIVNDTLGHAKGDELLQKSAMILKTACRKEDVIVRFGGDEFIILLSQTSKEVAQEIIRRIDQLSSKQFVNSFPISISFGWDAKENSEENILEVLNNAEKSMYKRKALYKNEIL
jgi:diguanylate cyclase (GGDEF)-like protein